MHRAAVLSVLSALSATAFAEELRAPAITRGIEELSRYLPANTFDSDPTTAFCAPDAHLLFFVSQRDAAALEHLEAIRISASDAGVRTVRVHLYYQHEPYDAVSNGFHTALDNGDARIEIPAAWDRRNATMVEIAVEWTNPNARPVCITEIAFLGANGELALPDLRAAVDQWRAREHDLAAVHAVTKAYVAAFRWIYFNPHKLSSTWESARYDFRLDGTFTRTVHDETDQVSTGTWTVEGKTLVIDDWRVPLGPCAAHPGYFCGARFVPTAAQ